MIADLRAGVIGVSAALVAPFWLSPKRLPSLTRAPENAPAQRTGNLSELRQVRRFSDRAIAALPRPLWRNSCLYRSIAGCLALRWYGVPATVVVGVRKSGEAVEAHAWVAVNGAAFPAGSAETGHSRDCEGAGAFEPLVAADSRSRA